MSSPSPTLSSVLSAIANGTDHISNYTIQNSPTFPNDCTTWLSGLLSLKGVPFNYLIADEKMLPKESIRFFQVDDLWLDALLQGAFSIGRITELDKKLDEHNYLSVREDAVTQETGYKENVFSGFLMRSQLVQSYPTMVYKAYDSAGKELSKVRLEKISDSVILGIFAGEKPQNPQVGTPVDQRIAKLYIQEPQEGLHFGIDAWNEGASSYTRTLKNLSGAHPNTDPAGSTIKTGTPATDLTVPVSFRGNSKTVIQIDALAKAMQSGIPTANQRSDGKFTAAEFALEMVEQTENYTFEITKPSNS
ncbi:hypothetical protein [Roseivirga thermotolerans]|uniref:Uncharacterized protein n=1 Tax=Roseivirga thermotolerans TaxID=1758176 RepID=A0ABQ3I5C6_9BACT|nr:hypothetical protein [Roseivirga thermotolerans]GHE55777.1 hypothetical protein GCM10011340_08190 [Roseivirga thermotolerans]